MSLHKLTAGSGYTYLTRQVAAHDRVSGDRSSLASYYSEKGETPGRWVGSGMAGIDGLDVGDEVTAQQMRALFGAGLHPLSEQRRERLEGPGLTDRDFKAVTRLGVPFKVYTAEANTFQVQVARRIEDHNASLGHPRDYPVEPDVRARVRSEVAAEMFRVEHDRAPQDARELSGFIAKASRQATSAVAGFDLTFSPVKSVSALWALAPRDVAGDIRAAHDAAVADTLFLVEREVAHTRVGRGGARQVKVRGLVAAAFTHRDSRAGDPDLHTHVAVSNKVQAEDGRWLALDGRLLYAAKVAASEHYNTRIEAELVGRLGVDFVERPGHHRQTAGPRDPRSQHHTHPLVVPSPRRHRGSSGRDRRRVPATSAALPPPSRPSHSPTRQRSRPATPSTATAASATSERPGVERPTTSWATPRRSTCTPRRSTGTPRALTREGGSRTPPPRPRRDPIPRDLERLAPRAEAHRQVRAGIAREQVDAVVQRGRRPHPDRHLRATDAGRGRHRRAAQLRRPDGASVYDVHGATLYTSAKVLSAENELLALAARPAPRRP